MLLPIIGILYGGGLIAKHLADHYGELVKKRNIENQLKSQLFTISSPEELDLDLIRIEFDGQPWRSCKCGNLSLPFELCLEVEMRCEKCHHLPVFQYDDVNPEIINRIPERYRISLPEGPDVDRSSNEPVIIQSAGNNAEYVLIPNDPRHLIMFGQFMEEAWETESWNGIPFEEGGKGLLIQDTFRILGYSNEDAIDLMVAGFTPWEPYQD